MWDIHNPSDTSQNEFPHSSATENIPYISLVIRSNFRFFQMLFLPQWQFLKVAVTHREASYRHIWGSCSEIQPRVLTQAPVSAGISVFSPFWISEGDVVLLCPACKHLFFCDKAVVVSSSAALILYVCHTFIRPPRFVVVVRHLLGCRFSAVIGWNHPVYFDVVTNLNGYDHREPARAQP